MPDTVSPWNDRRLLDYSASPEQLPVALSVAGEAERLFYLQLVRTAFEGREAVRGEGSTPSGLWELLQLLAAGEVERTSESRLAAWLRDAL